MQDDEEKAIEQLAGEIARYLKAHPNAADGIEGISKWWLTRQRYENNLIKIQQALDYLSDKGLVNCSTLPGGETVYSSQRAEHKNNNDTD